jgi:maintenance of morphology protein 1
MENQIEQAVQLANGEFIKGFIAGQVILCVLIFFLLKVFLFRNSAETKLELQKVIKRTAPKTKMNTLQQTFAIDSLILSKLKYDSDKHPFETTAWLNVLLAQVISTLRNDHLFLNGLCTKLQKLMNKENRPTFLGKIHITELSLGDEYPEFRNARIAFSDTGNMQIKVDFKYDDQVTLAIDTMALVNWPKPIMASLPIQLSFSLVKFSGTVILEFQPISDSENSNSEIIDSQVGVFVSPDFVLEFAVGSLLGHRTKVKDLPKLTVLLQTMLKNVFSQEIVYPAKKSLKLPKFTGFKQD